MNAVCRLFNLFLGSLLSLSCFAAAPAAIATPKDLSSQITPLKKNLGTIKDTYFADISPTTPAITTAAAAIDTAVATTGTDQGALTAVTNAMTAAMTAYAAAAQTMIQAQCTTAIATIDTLLDPKGTLTVTIPTVLGKISTAGASTKASLTAAQAKLVSDLKKAKTTIQSLKSKSIVSSTAAAKTFAYATTIRKAITDAAAAIAPTLSTTSNNYAQQIETLKINATTAYIANPTVLQQAQVAATAATTEYTTANNSLQVTKISSACSMSVVALSSKLDTANQNQTIANGWSKLSHNDAIKYLTNINGLKAILLEEQGKLATLNSNINTAINTSPKTEALLDTINNYIAEGQRIQTRLKTQINTRFTTDLKTSTVASKLAALNTYLTTVLATPPTPPVATVPAPTVPTIAEAAKALRTGAGTSTTETPAIPTPPTIPAAPTTPTAPKIPAMQQPASTMSADVRNAQTAAEQSDPTRSNMGLNSQQSTDINGMTTTTASRRGGASA